MLEGLTPEIKIPSCRVRTILETLEPKDQKILREALTDGRWTGNSLSKALNSRGIKVGDKVITKHMIGGCSCSTI